MHYGRYESGEFLDLLQVDLTSFLASDGRRTFLKVSAISYNIDPDYMTKGKVNRELKQRRR